MAGSGDPVGSIVGEAPGVAVGDGVDVGAADVGLGTGVSVAGGVGVRLAVDEHAEVIPAIIMTTHAKTTRVVRRFQQIFSPAIRNLLDL